MARKREVAHLNAPAPCLSEDRMTWLDPQGNPPILDEQGALVEPFVIEMYDSAGDLLKRERWDVGITLPATPGELTALQAIIAPLNGKGQEVPATDTWHLFGIPMVGRVPTPFYPAGGPGTFSHGGDGMPKAKTATRGAQKSAAEKEEAERKARVRNRAWKRARAVSESAKDKFVKDWDAGKIDWKALERQFAEEDKKPRVVGAKRTGNGNGKVKANGKPVAKGNGRTAHPKAEASAGRRNRKVEAVKVNGKPFTKEMQTGRKPKGDRKAIQKQMADANGHKPEEPTKPEPAEAPSEPVTASTE